MAKAQRYTIELKQKQPDGTYITTKIAEVDQVRNRDGSYTSTVVSIQDFISEKEQREYEQKMLKNTGRMMSDFYAGQSVP